MRTEQPYNPLDRLNLGISVTQALLSRDPGPLAFSEPFNGAGVYAIYYTGDFAPYAKFAGRNRNNRFEAPIYVGKAIPKGSRKGIISAAANASLALYARLSEHADSITAAESLKIEDFHCRYLVVEDIWIPLGESLLINQYSPVWNLKLDGFGNHDPGSGRYNQKRAPWDVVHPGRSWAAKLKDNPKTAEDFTADIEAFLRGAATEPDDPTEEESSL